MMRRLFYFAFIWPIERLLKLVRNVFQNGFTLSKVLRRGMTLSPRSRAPTKPGMTPEEVDELDAWWATLSLAKRAEVWAEHDAALVEEALEIERSGRGIWSLTTDVNQRKRGLRKQRFSYVTWMVIFSATSLFFAAVILLGKASVLFVLMASCFISLIAPQVLSLRVTRGQLLYGRKISYIEFFKPFPKELQLPERHALPEES